MRAEPERWLMLIFWTVLVAVLFIALDLVVGLIIGGALIAFTLIAARLEARDVHR